MIKRTPSQTTISHLGVSDYTVVFYVRKRIDSLIKREGYGPVNLGLWGDSLVVTWLILSHFPVVPNFKLWGLFNLIKKKSSLTCSCFGPESRLWDCSSPQSTPCEQTVKCCYATCGAYNVITSFCHSFINLNWLDRYI